MEWEARGGEAVPLPTGSRCPTRSPQPRTPATAMQAHHGPVPLLSPALLHAARPSRALLHAATTMNSEPPPVREEEGDELPIHHRRGPVEAGSTDGGVAQEAPHPPPRYKNNKFLTNHLDNFLA